jgi:hypothetical protein
MKGRGLQQPNGVKCLLEIKTFYIPELAEYEPAGQALQEPAVLMEAQAKQMPWLVAPRAMLATFLR